jgi:hypothetical protein
MEIAAARSSGNPKIPVEIAGKATDRAPTSSARLKAARTAEASNLSSS